FLRVKKDPNRNKRVAKVLGQGISIALIGLLIDVANHPGGVVISHSVLAGSAMVFGPVVLLIVLEACNVDIIGGFINLVLAPFRGIGNAMSVDRTKTITAQNGWNWENPEVVSEKKYGKIRSLLLDFANGTIHSWGITNEKQTQPNPSTAP